MTIETASAAARVNERRLSRSRGVFHLTRSPEGLFQRRGEEHSPRRLLGSFSPLAVSRAGLGHVRLTRPQPGEASAAGAARRLLQPFRSTGTTAHDGSSHATGTFHPAALVDARAPTASGTAPALASLGGRPERRPAAPADGSRPSMRAAAQRPTRTPSGHPFVASRGGSALEGAWPLSDWPRPTLGPPARTDTALVRTGMPSMIQELPPSRAAPPCRNSSTVCPRGAGHGRAIFASAHRAPFDG